jgi:hypothetical protein
MVMSAVSSERTLGVLVTLMPFFWRCIDIDVVDAIAEIGDQLHLRAGLFNQRRVDLVGHRGHQNIGRAHGRHQFGLGTRFVVMLSSASKSSRIRVST